MFDFESVEMQVTAEMILERISEEDIFRRYISNFQDINKSFCSELRIDSKPDCRIYVSSSNKLYYKDFANGDHLDCFYYVMKKFNCNYFEALNIIANDFNIKKLEYRDKIIPGFVKKMDKPIRREKARIEIVSQPFNYVDYSYWEQFGIDLELLNQYNVFSCKYVYLYKGINRYILEYNKKNPVYAYRFTRPDDYSYKIYKPLEPDKTKKWLFSGGASDDIEGYDQLNLHGDVLILTKSLKDCMCYRSMGYDAISLQGEGNKLEQELVNKLLNRFSKIIINYDQDPQGIISTNKLIEQYGFDHFYIDNAKDLSDYIKAFGIDKAKRLIKKKIKLCMKQ